MTVIIPSYNRAVLLDKTLRSFEFQSSSEFKIVIVDHGSTDRTGDIIVAYKRKLPIEYYCIERCENSPGIPRDFGVKKTKTPLIAFLDCGTVMPSSYVAAHCEFHHTYNDQAGNLVGLGLCHGHRTDGQQDDRWVTILQQCTIDETERLFKQDSDLCDERVGIDLHRLNLPWLYGWTGNMSLRTEDYRLSGGFDLEVGYGFEDLDLAYRLHKHGLNFAFVEGGWGLHLPHPRASLVELEEMEGTNWRISYWKHRSLALEAIRYAKMDATKGEEVFDYLTSVGYACAKLQPVSQITHFAMDRPVLLVGGTMQDLECYDYVSLANENIVSTSRIWSCSGIIIPLADRSLDTVVVSDMWKYLGCSFNADNMSLLECLISEIKRCSRIAIFVDSAYIPDVPGSITVSINELTNTCHKYDLSFQIINRT